MTAAGSASEAADKMEEVVSGANQMKTMLGQINMVRNQLREEKCHEAKGLLASAARVAAGGTGSGQMLQVLVGQTQVKLDELGRVLQTAADLCDTLGEHGQMVQGQITGWVETLRS